MKNSHRILFLGLPSGQSYLHAMAQPQYIGCRYLMSTLRGLGYDAQMLNISLDPAELDDILFSTNSQQVERYITTLVLARTLETLKAYDLRSTVLGVTTSWQHIRLVLPIVRAIKKQYPHVVVLLGGVYATLNGSVLMRDCPQIDFVLAGEAELTIAPFMEALEGKGDLTDVRGLVYRTDRDEIVENPPAPVVANLNDLPLPAGDDIGLIYRRNDDRIRISSARGCYGRCTFCSINAFHRSINCLSPRMRSARATAAEMEYWTRAHGIRRFVFVDPNFFVSGRRGKRRALELVDHLLARRLDVSFKIDARANDIEPGLLASLKRAGLYGVELGVESFDDDVLAALNKGITAQQNLAAIDAILGLDLELTISYIFYTPWTTRDSMKRTLPLIRELMNRPQVQWFPIFKSLQVLRGTTLFDRLRSQDPPGRDGGHYDHITLDSDVAGIRRRHMAFCQEVAALLDNTPPLRDGRTRPRCEAEVVLYEERARSIRNLTVTYLEALVNDDVAGELRCRHEYRRRRIELRNLYDRGRAARGRQEGVA